MATHGSNGDDSREESVDEVRDRQSEFVSEGHGLTVHISECDWTRWQPKSAVAILLGQVKARRARQRCARIVSLLLHTDWEAAQLCGNCGEDEDLAFRLFVRTDSSGRFILSECGLPKSTGYCQTGRELYRIDPLRFPSMKVKKGEEPRYHQQLVKDLVVGAFSKKAAAWWAQQGQPLPLTLAQMVAVLSFYLGDYTHRVTHRTDLESYLPLTQGEDRPEGRLKFAAPNTVEYPDGSIVVLYDERKSRKLEAQATELLQEHGFDETV